ncbi:MAG: hypothetical protein ABSD53_11745 [Terriglobales bacterium]|jgi:hypothetical protein
MSIKLLPASVNPVDRSQAPDVSTSLVPLTQRAITPRAGQHSLVPSRDTFSWSHSTPQDEAKWIDGTPVEDAQSDARDSAGEYLSGLAWSRPVASTAIANYLFYAAAPAAWSGHLIDVYA